MNIEAVIKLRNEGHLEEARLLILKILEASPEDANANYQGAWCHDVMGLETQAIYFYEKAIRLGLSNDVLKDAYLGLGSTLRAIGEYEKSLAVFEDALEVFEDNSLKVFYAMTLYNIGKHADSMEILMKLLAQTSNDKDLMSYRDAILYYSDKLDEKFK